MGFDRLPVVRAEESSSRKFMGRRRAWNCVGVTDGDKSFLTSDLPVG
jgi:hypothetical protein